MTTIEHLRSLQTRIRSSKGADREIDWLILSKVCHHWRDDKASAWRDDQYVDMDGKIHDPDEICWTAREDGKVRYEHCPRYTASLDACVALLHEVLPGCEWERHPNGSFSIWKPILLPIDWRLISNISGSANDCLTFLDAIVEAFCVREEAKEKV